MLRSAIFHLIPKPQRKETEKCSPNKKVRAHCHTKNKERNNSYSVGDGVNIGRDFHQQPQPDARYAFLLD